jgi:glucosyl-dolichyl phosphate glucuronosyltransferase
MKLTVAIPTWNRAALLHQTLDAMTRLHIPAGVEWKLIVVNNNCSDATDQVLHHYGNRLPLQRCAEPRPGLSHARNRAVENASGDYLLWADDDILVEPDWLEAYCRAFARWPDAAVFGGRVEPWFTGASPRWLPQVFPRVACAFAAVDHGDVPLRLDRATLPFGANLVIRMAEQKRHRFDPELGVRPGSRMGGEETQLVLDILHAGGTGWYVPDARVRHHIPQHRQTIRYLRSYYHGHGELQARHLDDSAAKWFGKPRWVIRQAVEAEVRFRLKRLFARPTAWIDDLIRSSTAWGILGNYGHRTAATRHAPEAAPRVVA